MNKTNTHSGQLIKSCEIKRSNHQQLQEQHQQQLATNVSHEEVPNSKNGKKHFLLLAYEGKKADDRLKSMKKTVHESLLETNNTKKAYTGRKRSTCYEIKVKANLINSMTWCIIQSALVSYVTKIIQVKVVGVLLKE